MQLGVGSAGGPPNPYSGFFYSRWSHSCTSAQFFFYRMPWILLHQGIHSELLSCMHLLRLPWFLYLSKEVVNNIHFNHDIRSGLTWRRVEVKMSFLIFASFCFVKRSPHLVLTGPTVYASATCIQVWKKSYAKLSLRAMWEILQKSIHSAGISEKFLSKVVNCTFKEYGYLRYSIL